MVSGVIDHPSSRSRPREVNFTVAQGFSEANVASDGILRAMLDNLKLVSPADQAHGLNETLAGLNRIRTAEEQRGVTVVGADEHKSRLLELGGLAGTLFSAADGSNGNPLIEAVLFLGSYVRGKQEPGDIDGFYLTRLDPDYSEFSPVMSPLEAKAQEHLVNQFGDKKFLGNYLLQLLPAGNTDTPLGRMDSDPCVVFSRGQWFDQVQVCGVFCGTDFKRYAARKAVARDAVPMIGSWG